MSVSAPPVFSDTVDQSFFIEAQGGSQHPVSYLDRFPDSVYTKGIDSVLVTLAYALLGPAGAGLLREQYLQARLQIEDAGLSTDDLDSLYTSPFAFARAALETYSLDASASLLSSQQRAQILSSDAAFRNRAITWFKAIRAGGTLQGLTLAAQSALNHPVELIENYRALYDQYSDIPLGLPIMGTTTSLNEVIVLPRQDVPTNSQQTFSISGEPTLGWFSLTAPLGPNYQSMMVGATNGSATYTVPNSTQTPPGTYFTIVSGGSSYGQVASIVSPTSVNVIWAPQTVNAGLPLSWSGSTGTFLAYAGNAQTALLPFNATYAQVQAALWALPLIGTCDVTVTGGPLPDQPIVITYGGKLADQPIPTIQVNLGPDSITGVGNTSSSPPLVSQLADVTESVLNIAANVTVNQVGVSADSQSMTISPANEHAMEVTLDVIRPATSFITTVAANGVTTRQPSNTVFAGQTYTEVLRYETGQASIAWSNVDSLHWIQGGIEREAPRPVGDLSHHYQGFHNIANVTAYTEEALGDSGYGSGETNVANVYWDSKVGLFSPAQVALYPFLTRYQDTNAQYPASQAVAVSPEPMVITDTVNGIGIINSLYPADYLSLSGIPQLSTSQTFWASTERIAQQVSPAVDYLEIDLGSPQAVNYLYFEATNKPYSIDVAYDILDQSPARNFVPVTLMDPSYGPSTTILVYDTSVTNPWTTVEFHCANTLNQMIYTRYLRIGFTRAPGNNPFTPTGLSPVPYSIEVRNLRVGRNVTSDSERTLAISRVMGTTYWSDIYPASILYPGSTVIPS